MSVPTKVAARVTGDKYQYLVVLYTALKILRPESRIVAVRFEIPEPVNVDDLVAESGDGSAAEYHQIKFAVQPSGEPLTDDWFTVPKIERGTSPLQKFKKSFDELGAVPMVLQTNRDARREDPIVGSRAGLDDALGARLRAAKDAATRDALDKWADHLKIDRPALLDFLDHLRLVTGEWSYLRLMEACGDRMYGAGLRGERVDVLHALAAVEDLVTKSLTRIDRQVLEALIDEHGLRVGEARATLLVQQVTKAPFAGSATIALDWTERFVDDAHRLVDDACDWNGDMLGQLEAAADELKARGFHRVLIAGSPRLSGWFAAGFALRKVNGFAIGARSTTALWESDSAKASMPVGARDPIAIGEGPDVAFALTVAQAIFADVHRYLTNTDTTVGELVELRPPAAPDDQLIADAGEARGLMTAFFNAMASVAAGRRIHLFAAAPGPLLALLGHRWNRMPAVQLYDDTGAAGDPTYLPTFALPQT